MIVHWEDLELWSADGTGSQVSFERGSPAGMNMDRVASASSAMENCDVCRLPIGAALENIKAIAAESSRLTVMLLRFPSLSNWLNALLASAASSAC
jgi:hypothetical protein